MSTAISGPTVAPYALQFDPISSAAMFPVAKMKRAVLILLALLCATAGAADELAGLWKAKKRFGPDARGPLVMQRRGSTWTADMVGRIVPVSTANGELTFTL